MIFGKPGRGPGRIRDRPPRSLVQGIIRADGSSSLVATAIGGDVKGRISVAAYAASTGGRPSHRHRVR
jgi:hypothetical protein